MMLAIFPIMSNYASVIINLIIMMIIMLISRV